jgi:uncharacterized protein with PIN domain
MHTLRLRFYASLNDFLPKRWKQRTFTLGFLGQPTVRELLIQLNIPPPEVAFILAEDRAVDFDYRPQEGERLSFYPIFYTLIPGSPLETLPVERPPRFLLDTHLGRLARYLRMLGFDAEHFSAPDPGDGALVQRAAQDGRVLLTRDRRLLARKAVRYGYFVRATAPQAQLLEVVDRFALQTLIRPFSRCLCCNVQLEPVDAQTVAAQLPPEVRRHYTDFYRCPSCGRIYWEGSHHARMQRLVDQVLQGRDP